MHKCAACDNLTDKHLCDDCRALRAILNASSDDLREQVERKLELRAEELAGPWKKWTFVLAGVSIAITIVSVVINYLGIPTEIRRQVGDKMTEPHIREAAFHAATNSTAPLIEKTKTDVAELKKELNAARGQLLNAHKILDEKVLIQELQSHAKGGDLAAYRQLQTLQTNLAFAQSAKAALLDVGFFFVQFSRTYEFSHGENGKPVTDSVEDDVWYLFQPNPEHRVISAFQLRHHARPSTLLPLRDALAIETNLFAIAQMVLSIGALTGKTLHCLDVPAALLASSYATNSSNNHWYHCIIEEWKDGREVRVNPGDIDEVIQCTTRAIEQEPFAFRAMCLRGWCYARKNNRIAADADFAAVEKLSSDFPWLLFYKGLTRIGFNEEKAGADLLNRLFKNRPDLSIYAQACLAPHWHTNSLIAWPDQPK